MHKSASSLKFNASLKGKSAPDLTGGLCEWSQEQLLNTYKLKFSVKVLYMSTSVQRWSLSNTERKTEKAK